MKIIKRTIVSVKDTLQTMAIGESWIVSHKLVKANTLRSTISTLQKNSKMVFIASEAGLTGQTLIIRTK